jgi:ribosomal protein L29
MKAVDKKTLHEKTAKELEKLVTEAYKSLNALKLDHVQNKLKDTRSIFNKRKEIAVMQSILKLAKSKVKEETDVKSETKAK